MKLEELKQRFENVNSKKISPIEALNKGYIDIAEKLIDRNIKLNATDRDGETALMWAAREGKESWVQKLIKKGADVSLISKKGKGGCRGKWTALSWATYKNHTKIAKMLIDAGAELDVINEDRNTALHLALHNQNLELSLYLIEKDADFEISEGNGQRAIHLAIITPRNSVKYEYNARTRRSGYTPSFDTSPYGMTTEFELKVIQKLIERNANIDATDHGNYTALTRATENDKAPIAEMLINAGANLDIRNMYGKTFWDYASKTNDPKITAAVKTRLDKKNATIEPYSHD